MQQHDIYERARLSRDARFDGQFFVGVRTTGIYCRPICPAVAPKSENVTFYPSAAAAGEAGFRPCLRCRPECAPGTPAWSGTSTTVRRGLRLISNGALDDGSIESLAERLGVTSRHLRRLFTTHVGASPLAVAHTQRLHFAKRLIDQTSLPLAHVATAAGYGSVRRFNDTFKKTYGQSPRDLRRSNNESVDGDTALTVRLPYRKPFDWLAIMQFFRGRATPSVEQVVGDAYFRTISVAGRAGVIECHHQTSDESVSLSLHGIATEEIFRVVQRVREMLDLDAPVADIANVLSADKKLGEIIRQKSGVRVPGAWDGFELTVRAILGQQVSVKAATTLAGRIARRYGTAVKLPVSLCGRSDELTIDRTFPTARKLARARFNDIGLTTSRAETIRRVASAVVRGDIDFDNAQDPDEFCVQLTTVRGIGDWTAEYVAMRALKYPDAFPSSDLGLLKAMESNGKISAAELRCRAESWRPWRAYAALLLWNSLPGSGG
jgi:AraC family transcriptional regulator of adaptative response / DNA-3-methyladenine glycosylase II